MTINQNELFVEPGQGHCYWFGQDLYTFKAVGEDTGEAYALCEVVVAPQGGTPIHRHNRENESFYQKIGLKTPPFSVSGGRLYISHY